MCLQFPVEYYIPGIRKILPSGHGLQFQPEDWDDEEDGEWTAPTMANPEYKGPWKQKVCRVLDLSNFIWLNTRLMSISFLQKIKNPNYKGKWKAPMIANPGGCLSFEGFPCYPNSSSLCFVLTDFCNYYDMQILRMILISTFSRAWNMWALSCGRYFDFCPSKSYLYRKIWTMTE